MYLQTFGRARHRVDQLAVDRRRIKVEQADPLDAVDLVQAFQQVRKAAAAGAAIAAPHRRVLRDKISSLVPACGERARFFEDRLFASAAERAAQLRNDAERARMIAALGDLQIRGRSRRRNQPRKKIVLGLGFEIETHGPLAGSHVVEQFDDAAHTRRYRRRRRSRGSALAAGRRSAAPGIPQPPAAGRVACAAACSRMVSVDSALAGSMNAHVLITTVSASRASADKLHTGRAELRDHHLGVDEILGAAKADETDARHQR